MDCSWILKCSAARERRLKTSDVQGRPALRCESGVAQTLWPDPNTSAYGMLYSENSVRAYRPEAILVHLDDGPGVPALTFNLVESPHLNEHNSEYAAKLRELARRIELPTDYVNRIQ